MLTTLMILALAAAGQDPAPPYRVESLDVTAGEVKLAGTLTIPQSTDRAVPAVVLITGSGPQTRDEDVFGFKVFATLADHLTRQGIAVYRYDDCGAGDLPHDLVRWDPPTEALTSPARRGGQILFLAGTRACKKQDLTPS